MTIAFRRPLYILPFDRRGPLQPGLLGSPGPLGLEQTARFGAATRKLDDALWAALAGCSHTRYRPPFTRSYAAATTPAPGPARARVFPRLQPAHGTARRGVTESTPGADREDT